MTTETEDLLWRRFNEWFRARRPDYPSEWDAYQAGHADAKAETAAAVAAERERAARVCERIADDYNQREGLKYAELKTDAETGANECADAIRAGAKETSDG